MLCTQCGHSNPDGASHCASCAAPLPAMINCPSCQELVSTDAYFCAHCGTPIQSADSVPPPPPAIEGNSSVEIPPVPPTEVVNLSEVASVPNADIPATNVANPALAISQPPDLLTDDAEPQTLSRESSASNEPSAEFTIFPETDSSAMPSASENLPAADRSVAAGLPPEPEAQAPAFNPPVIPSTVPPTNLRSDATQIQQPMACLVHVRSDTTLSIPIHLDIVHLGKPNERVPPDIDVSGFPDSDVVSRVHADLRLEADGYYLQDSGSANGTYVNNQALRTGDRYRLRTGDRVSFGKEDKVSFIFQAG